MSTTRYLLAVLMTGLLACGAELGASQEDPAQYTPPGEDVAATEAALHKKRPTLTGWTVKGLCSELRAISGATEDSMGRIGVSGAIACFDSYGIDGVAFWGEVRAGYIAAISNSPTVQVNGSQVGAMDVQLTGAAATKLFSILPPKSGSSTVRSSPQGRMTCTKSPSGATNCQVTGLVGFESPSIYF